VSHAIEKLAKKKEIPQIDPGETKIKRSRSLRGHSRRGKHRGCKNHGTLDAGRTERSEFRMK